MVKEVYDSLWRINGDWGEERRGKGVKKGGTVKGCRGVTQSGIKQLR
jgi:hypothetical protein